MKKNTKKNKVKNIVIIALILLVIGLLVTLDSQRYFVSDTIHEILRIDDNAVDVTDEEQPGSEAASIEIPGYGSMTLKADRIVQEVFLHNPEGNNCYFLISLFLPDGTRLYQSGLIPPGKVIYSAEFSIEVSAGTYENAILQYQCFRLSEEREKINGARTHLTLIFE